MSLNVRGFLSNSKFPDGYTGMFKHDDGRSMTPTEAREELYNELSKGREVIPMISREDDPCPAFDFGGEGCPGHEDRA